MLGLTINHIKSYQFNQTLVTLVLEESINEYRHESYREC
jgi:hypothetical protein